jgi:stage III sporulation protein AE
MLVILWLAVPPLLSLLCYRAVFALAAFFADLTDAAALARLFRNTQGVLAAAFAITVCFAVMLIISTALMLVLLRNA